MPRLSRAAPISSVLFSREAIWNAFSKQAMATVSSSFTKAAQPFFKKGCALPAFNETQRQKPMKKNKNFMWEDFIKENL